MQIIIFINKSVSSCVLTKLLFCFATDNYDQLEILIIDPFEEFFIDHTFNLT